MDKVQQKALVKGWELQSKIIKDITALAEMNEGLAYGCIRTAETLIDMIMVGRIEKARKDCEASSNKPEK